MDNFVDYMIRPRRIYYSTLQLGLPKFTLKESTYVRKDFQLKNKRNLTLRCSAFSKEGTISSPWIIYCHGNSGSRLDSLDILESVLPLNISVVSFDFSGSGQSEGDWVSMGYFEKDDIEVVVNYVNQHLNSTSIGIWGRSMGAVSALLYSSSHRTMDFVIAESPFASLRTLCVELVNSHTVKKIQKIPKIFASMLVTRLKKAVLKTANFDVDHVEVLSKIQSVKCPVLLIHSQDDELIPVSHANALMDKARNNVSFIQTVGSHNAARSRSLLEKIIVFISDLIEEKPFEEEATEDIMPSLIGLGHFSVRNQGLRQDTERKLEVNNYFKMAQKALSKK